MLLKNLSITAICVVITTTICCVLSSRRGPVKELCQDALAADLMRVLSFVQAIERRPPATVAEVRISAGDVEQEVHAVDLAPGAGHVQRRESVTTRGTLADGVAVRVHAQVSDESLHHVDITVLSGHVEGIPRLPREQVRVWLVGNERGYCIQVIPQSSNQQGGVVIGALHSINISSCKQCVVKS